MPKVEAFEKKMREQGYRVSLLLQRDADLSSLETINNILAQNPSGVALFAFPGIRKILNKLKIQKIPYIILGVAEKGIDHVGMDRPGGIEAALEHLQAKKRKQIAYLGDEKPKHFYGKATLN